MKDTNQTQESRNSREIQQDIRGVRENMDQTLDSLNDRLSPRALIHSLLDWFDKRDSSSNLDLSRRPKQLARFVRDNPVPALLTGIGVAWLIAESQSDDEESEFKRNRVDHDSDDDWVGRDDGKSVTDKLKDKLGDASDAVSSAASATRDKLSSARDQVAELGGRATRGYAHAEVRFKEAVDDYPFGFGAGFLGLGLLTGLLLPRSEAEDEWFGEMADEMKDTVTDKGEELMERGKEVAGRVAHEATEEAERQGLSVDNAASALKSIGEKVGLVVEAAKEEGKKAVQDERLTPADLKAEAQSEGRRFKDKAAEKVESY